MKKVAMLLFVFVAVLYITTLAFLFSAPPSARSLIYRLQVKLSYRAWATNLTGVQGVLREEHKFSRINGSAVAISAGGDLLTERHVVDANFYMPWPCGEWFEIIDGKEVKMNIRIESLELVATASNGHQWRGIARPENPNGPWCDEQNHMRFKWDPKSDAVIVAMDDVHDLALVSIKTLWSIPYVRLEIKSTSVGKDVQIGGFPKGDANMKLYSGIVMAPCEMNYVITPMSVIRVTPRVSAGVSGGPIIAGNRLVGIVLGSVNKYETVGVPGPYITKWLDWVNGRASNPPEPVCSP